MDKKRLNVLLTTTDQTTSISIESSIVISELVVYERDLSRLDNSVELAEITSKTGKQMLFFVLPSKPKLLGYSDLMMALPLDDGQLLYICVPAENKGIKEFVRRLKTLQERLKR
jgi:hypothetical protein